MEGPRRAKVKEVFVNAKDALVDAKDVFVDAKHAAKDFIKDKTAPVLERLRHTKLGDAAAVLQRARIYWLNDVDTRTNEHHYQRFHQKATRVGTKVENYDGAIAAKEAKIADRNKIAEDMRARGELTPKAAARLEAEKTGLVADIESLRKKRDKKGIKLEGLNNEKAFWENKQKEIARQVAAQVEKKSKPHVDRFEDLKKQREGVVANIKYCAELKSQAQKGLSELEERRKTGHKVERPGIRARIREAQKTLNQLDAYVIKLKSRQEKLGNKMRATQERINRWKVVPNVFNRIGGRDRQYKTAVGEEVSGDFKNQAYSFDEPEPESQETPEPQEDAQEQEPVAPQPPPAMAAAVGGTARPERAPRLAPQEAEPEMTPDQFIGKWNKLAVGLEKINVRSFKQNSGLMSNPSIAVKSLEDMLRSYILKIKNPEGHLFITEQGIKTRIEKMRVTK